MKEIESIDISRLKGTEKVRKRVNVLSGSNDIKGVQHVLFEAISNSTDESKKGYGSKIEVVKHKNGSYTIKDNGRGIPIHWNEKENMYNWQLLFTTLYAGSNYGENVSGALGANGIGDTLLNASSEYCIVESTYEGNSYLLAFKEGRPIANDNEEFKVDMDLFDNPKFLYEDNDAEISEKKGLKAFKKIESDRQRGTAITYKPDNTIFTETDIDSEWIEYILQEHAGINKGIEYVYKDEIKGTTKSFLYENGIIDYIQDISKGISDINSIEGSGIGNDQEKDVNRSDYGYSCKFELVWGLNTEDNFIKCFHNSSHLSYGGSTLKAIEDGFTYAIDKLIKSNNAYKAKEKKIKFTDIEDCISCIINSFSSYTSYENQTKKSINNKFIKVFVAQKIKDDLDVIFKEQPILAKKVMEKVLINKRSRETSENTRLNIKKKLEKTSKIERPKSYVPCICTDKKIKELYIVEGDSALGGIVKGRDAYSQAATHVKGKMLSCYKASIEKIFNNEIVVQTIKLLGCGIDIKTSNKKSKSLSTFDIDELQWSKIIIATDADVDGFQIRCLILTMLYRLCPELIIQGYVYMVDSPLFEIETSDETLFAYTEEEKVNIVKSLESSKVKYGLSRNKGIGELEPLVVSETMMNPKTRHLIKINVEDIEKMHESFDLWMGNDASKRFDAIAEKFVEVKSEDIIEDTTEEEQLLSNIKDMNIEDVVDENYSQYAMSVVKERAIPEIDGFKPSHRKVLWTMYKMNLGGKRTKSANVTGQAMKYNPHGDQAIYETMIRLGQKDSLLRPFINSKGNFGDRNSTELQFAANRYTESGMSEICECLFDNINYNAVDFDMNYDNTLPEPKFLPVSFPNILVVPNKGIAVGMTACFASHNLNEVCDLTTAYLKDKNITVSDYLIAPDFATGGNLIYDKQQLENIYNSGKGSIKLRATYSYDEKKRRITVDSLPYNSKREPIIDKTIELMLKNKVKGINRIIDGTDLKGQRILIDLKKGTNPTLLMEKLYKMTPLEDSFSYNMNMICLDGKPRVLSVKQVLDQWIEFRKKSIRRVAHFKKDKLDISIKRLEFLSNINLDLLISTIRNSKSDKDTIAQIKKIFKADEDVATYLSNVALRQLNVNNVKARLKDLEGKIEQGKKYQKIIDCDEVVSDIIIKELKNVKNKFGKERMTKLINAEKIVSKKEVLEMAIDDYNCVVSVTNDGYFKKIPSRANKGEYKLKENDYIIKEYNVTNKAELLVFSDKGNCYKRRLCEIKDHKSSDLGEYITSFFEIENEKVIAVVSLDSFKEKLLFLFENGKLARVLGSSYQTLTNRTSIKNAINIKSKLILYAVEQENKSTDIFITKADNKCGMIDTKDVSIVGSKNSNGVVFIGGTKTKVVDAEIIYEDKRTGMEEFRCEMKRVGYKIK